MSSLLNKMAASALTAFMVVSGADVARAQKAPEPTKIAQAGGGVMAAPAPRAADPVPADKTPTTRDFSNIKASDIETNTTTGRATSESLKEENKDAVIIMILKGKKDEVNPNTNKPMTGQEIGEVLQGRFLKFTTKVGESPIRTIVVDGPSVGDYSSVTYFFRGSMMHKNMVGLKEAVELIGAIDSVYDLVRFETGNFHAPHPGADSKPQPSGHD